MKNPLHKQNYILRVQERAGHEQPVLLKESALPNPPFAHTEQLHNEYMISTYLAGVEGVRPIVGKEGSESHPVLLLKYIPGKSLADIIDEATFDLEGKLFIAIELAGILDRIHEHRVIHNEIDKSNILIDSDGSVLIIDFGLAAKISREGPVAVASNNLRTGSLDNIAPEQTGRMNRQIDQRSDLYALGVTLYELFSGQLPFQGSDPGEMIYNHIARIPKTPAEINSDVPPAVSKIILRLMAKDPENRYQTARGLLVDLQQCLNQYHSTGQMQAFELGRDDSRELLDISHKLYGREEEKNQLLDTLERVANGSAELLLIGGYSGVGKTSLVHELKRPIVERRGYFVEGKFDQYQRTTPFFAWGQALTALVNLWLMESESSINAWKVNILEAVGQSGQVLIDFIPSLERIIGPQPTVPKLSGIEAQNRLNYLLQRFISALARPLHPLVVFLDDLQWIDFASLKLFDILLNDPNGNNLLLIGAYRNNEVDAGHPLMLELGHLRETGCFINELTVDNLSLEAVNAFLSNSLRLPLQQSSPLARLIYTKTNGNAFFTRQLLVTLLKNGVLYFDHKSHRWHWEVTELKKLAITQNVVELLVDKIRRMPVDVQEVLHVASCLGTAYDLALIHQISARSQEKTRLALQAANEAGYVVQIDGSGMFVHDRIKQAAYLLVPDHKKPRLHRRIGQILLAETETPAKGERLFDIVGQLNMGLTFIEVHDERLELAELNLKAAEAAQQATAHAAAVSYAQTAFHLIGAKGWQDHYQLMLCLHLLVAEAAYLNADYDLSEQAIETVLTSARSDLDKAKAYAIRIDSYSIQHLLQAAIETGLSALRVLGVPLQEALPALPDFEVFQDMPLMSDQRVLAATEILAACIHPAYVGRPELLPDLIQTILHLTITHGLTPASCLANVTFAVIFGFDDDIEASFLLGRLTLQLAKRLDNWRYLFQVKTVFDNFLLPWKEPLSAVQSTLQQGIQLGYDTGNRNYLGTYLITDTIITALISKDLASTQAAMERNLRQLELVREQYKSYDAYLWTQYVAHLRGMAPNPTHFAGPYFAEEIDIPKAKAENIHNTTLHFHTLKAAIFFHLGGYSAAYEHIGQAELEVPLAASSINIHLVPFYQSLIILQLPDRWLAHNEKLEENVNKLRLWADHAPMNYKHKLDMVLAENARVAGDVGSAVEHYEKAISGAKENEFLQDEALANELFGRFWHQRGNELIARPYLREAHALYRRWGAGAIVAYLETQYPQWLADETIHMDLPAAPGVTISEIQYGLDLQSLMRSAEAIASELDLRKLLKSMIKIIMENAGAQRVFLIFERDGQWRIEAEGDVESGEIWILQSTDVTDRERISLSIVNYTAHAKQIVLLDDAASRGQFAHDPNIQRRHVRSVLSMPLINQGVLSGILYLENNLASQVFTPERVETLKLLSSQMAIAIDHAWLYEHLADEVAKRTEALSFAEDQIRTLFDSSQVGIGLTTNEGQILVTNKTLQGLLGYTQEEMLLSNVSEFYLDPEQRSDLLAKLLTSRAVNNFGVKLKHKNGSWFYANMNVSIVNREGQELIIAMIEDVTEKIRTEQALQASEKAYRDLVERISDVIYSIDTDGIVMYINPAIETILGIPPEEIVGQPFAKFIYPEDLEGLQDNFQNIAAGMVPGAVQCRILSPSGETRWIRVTGQPIEQEKGVIGIQGVLTDITERRMAEKLQQQLAVVKERDRLALDLHDTVTQSLYSITLQTDSTLMALTAGKEKVAEKRLEILKEIAQDAMAEMRVLIYQLQPSIIEEKGLAEAIQQRLELVENRSGIDVDYQVDGEPHISLNRQTVLFQVVQEGLNNVIKHARAKHLLLLLSYEPAKCRLTIEDDGVGFKPDKIDPHGGFGLKGMHKRLDEINGTMQIVTKPGSGTILNIEVSYE